MSLKNGSILNWLPETFLELNLFLHFLKLINACINVFSVASVFVC